MRYIFTHLNTLVVLSGHYWTARPGASITWEAYFKKPNSPYKEFKFFKVYIARIPFTMGANDYSY